MTNQKPTVKEIMEWLEGLEGHYGKSDYVVHSPYTKSIRARLLAAQKMADALRFYADPNHPKERRPIVPDYIDPAQAACIGTPPDFGIGYTDNSGHVARVALAEWENENEPSVP